MTIEAERVNGAAEEANAEDRVRQRSISGKRRIADSVNAVLYNIEPSSLTQGAGSGLGGLGYTRGNQSSGGRIRSAIANILSTN